MKANSTEIVFVVDRSGSMESVKADMIGSFAEFVRAQREVPGECKATLVQFDTVFEVVYAGLDLADVPALDLRPRGGTALLDAVGTAIQSTGNRLSRLPEHKRPSKVIVVVITDGYENSSHEFTHARVAEMVKHQQEKYSWDFVFLGAGLDSVSVASALNIQNAAAYVNNTVGIRAFTASVNNAVSASRTTGTPLVYSQAVYDSALDQASNTIAPVIITPTGENQ